MASRDRPALSLSRTPVERFVAALHDGDTDTVRELLEQYSEVRAAINEPLSHFNSRPIARAAKNLPLLDLLISYGADINLKSAWWAGAAFQGNLEMVRVLLRHNPAIGVRDSGYNGTPLNWCIYGAVRGWACRRGDFPSTVKLLLEAGERFELSVLPTGRDDVDDALRAHLTRRT